MTNINKAFKKFSLKVKKISLTAFTLLLGIITINSTFKNLFEINALEAINESLIKKRFAEAYGSAPVTTPQTISTTKLVSKSFLALSGTDADADNIFFQISGLSPNLGCVNTTQLNAPLADSSILNLGDVITCTPNTSTPLGDNFFTITPFDSTSLYGSSVPYIVNVTENLSQNFGGTVIQFPQIDPKSPATPPIIAQTPDKPNLKTVLESDFSKTSKPEQNQNIDQKAIKLSFKKDLSDSQIFKGAKFNVQADVLNPNNETVYSVKTLIDIDTTHLTLVDNSLKDGKIAKAQNSIFDTLFITANAESTSMKIISESQIELVFDTMAPNETKSVTFQVQSKVNGDAKILGNTEILGSDVRSQADLPILSSGVNTSSPILVRTGGRNIADFGIFLISIITLVFCFLLSLRKIQTNTEVYKLSFEIGNDNDSNVYETTQIYQTKTQRDFLKVTKNFTENRYTNKKRIIQSKNIRRYLT